MQPWMPWLLGGLGGAGVIAVYYGIKQVSDRNRDDGARKRGLWMVNLGVLLIVGTLAASIWLK